MALFLPIIIYRKISMVGGLCFKHIILFTLHDIRMRFDAIIPSLQDENTEAQRP